MKAVVRLAVLACALTLAAGETSAALAQLPAGGTLWAAYGSRPVVHCRPLYLTDVVLEPGEHVSTLAIGDSVRWRLGRGVAGAHGATQHLFVKPSAFATTTNLEVLTDRRVYDVELVNDGTAYTARLAFYAPRAVAPHLAAIVTRRQTAVAELPPRRHRRSASPQRVRFFRDYFTAGPMNVSHTADRTYVSLARSLRGRRLAFTSDATGRHFLAVVRRHGGTYELREVPARLYAWAGAQRVAWAQRWAP